MSDSAILNHDSRTADSAKSDSHGKSSYGRFLAMVGTSTALMFGLMYLNTYALEHVYWSETRFYMTFVMGATMTDLPHFNVEFAQPLEGANRCERAVLQKRRSSE
jgi:hypothetical protein